MRNTVVAIAIVGLLLLISFTSCFETCEEATRRIYLQESFMGTIDTIVTNPTDQKLPYCVVANANRTIKNEIYKQLSKGDTLIKRSGNMKYYWIKNGDTTTFYQMCGNREIDAVRD